EAGAQRRDDLVLEAVGEVGGVEQAEGDDGQLVPGLGLVDGVGEERRAGPARVTHRVALELEPGTEQLDLGRAPDPVGPLDDDQVSGKRPRLEIGEALAVPLLAALSPARHCPSPPWAAAYSRAAPPAPCAGPPSAGSGCRPSPRSGA